MKRFKGSRMSKKIGKESLSLGLKKEIFKFKNMYSEPEFRLIFQLDIVRGLKISFSCLGYLVWLFIARVGWSNAYSFYKLFAVTDRLKESLEVKEALNILGSLAFSLFIFALFILQVGKIMMSTNDNYINYLKPFQKGIKIICRQGTVLFLLSLYEHEIHFQNYYNTTTKLGAFLLLYLVSNIAEKMLFKHIVKQVFSDIQKESYCLKTPYGNLKNVELFLFKMDSKWDKYIYRSKEVFLTGSYNETLQESLYDTGAIFNNEPMVLKDFFGDYELVWNPKQLSEQGAENEFAEVH
ncbi:TPA: conjugal transfer protein TraA [Enterococcus faecium]|nr:conjugal transfer protein TraA [Enterococcus faecium]